MGRNRKPLEEHKLQGTVGKHPERKNFGSSALISYKGVTELEPPDCIRLLRARKAFRESSQGLLALGILTPLDAPNYEIAFRCFEKYLLADDALREFEKKMDIADPAEQAQDKLLLKRQKQYYDEWVQMGAKFGFTPADRAKLEMPEQQMADALQEFGI